MRTVQGKDVTQSEHRSLHHDLVPDGLRLSTREWLESLGLALLWVLGAIVAVYLLLLPVQIV